MTSQMRIGARVIAVLMGLPLLASCVTPRVIPDPVPTIDFLNGTDFIVTQLYSYRIGSTDTVLQVPAGFVTDYASIPPPLRIILAKQGRYSRAAVIHDYLYWSQICTREQSDNLMMIAMKELGVSKKKRNKIYNGVRIGGGSAWKKNQEERLVGNPKVVPAAYYGLATKHTWPEARQELVKSGVHDPAFAQNPAACALGNSTDVP